MIWTLCNRALLVWFLLIVFMSAAAAQDDKMMKYTVQPNDTCWSIAQKLYGDGKEYTIIHRFNELGPLPHVLEPGVVLTLPKGDDSALGKLSWLRKEVEAKPPTTDWLDAREDMSLWRLYRVRTGESASAGIEFEDRSHLSMKEQALLVVYGPGAGKSRLERRNKNKVSLETGSIRGGLAQLDEAAQLQVRTPSGNVQLNSRDTNIEVDNSQTSAISVYDGDARVSAQGKLVSVKDGEGTTVKKGKAPAMPTPLPKPPTWLGDTRDIVLVSTPGATNEFHLEWTAVSSAARYRVELAHDAAFRKVLTDAEIGSGIHSFVAKELVPGNYFVRVSTIAKNRLQSKASQTASIRIVEISPSRTVEVDPSGELLAVGWLKMDLPRKIGKEVEVAINDGAFQDGREPIRLFEPGRYHLRFRSKGSLFETEMILNILAIDAGFVLSNKAYPASAPAEIQLSVKDSNGRPALLPQLEVVSNSETPLALTQLSAGLYSITLPPTTGTTKLEAEWAGGKLAEATIEFVSIKDGGSQQTEQNTEASRHSSSTIHWPYTPIALSWSAPAFEVAARGARSFSNVDAGITTARAPGNSSNSPVYLKTDIGAQIGLSDNRFSVDARLSMFNISLDRDYAGDPAIDNLHLGFRTSTSLLSRSRLIFSTSFRITVPTSHRTDIPQRDVTFEPALLLEWQALHNLHFAFNQVFVLTVLEDNQISAASYVSFLDSEFRMKKQVAFALQGGLHVTQPNINRDETSSVGSLMGGGAIRFYVDRLRISLQAGSGLNKNARELFGAYTFGLNLDLFLGE